MRDSTLDKSAELKAATPAGPVPRPGITAIRSITPSHHRLPETSAIRLWANESSLGPSPKAVAAYQAASARMFRYPDGDAVDVRTALATRYGVDVTRILMGIGSDELLNALVRAYAGVGDEVLFPTATFPMYRTYALAAGATPVQAPDRDHATDVDALLAKVTPATKVVIIANPNNPTGTYLNRGALERLRSELRQDVLLIIDAAYAEYCEQPDYESGVRLAETTGNTAMTRTFSKVHGLAGLRLGWLYASPEIISVIGRIRSPFNVSTPAQAAGVAALEDTTYQDYVIAHARKWRGILRQRMAEFGLATTGTEGNFVNIGFPTTPGATAADAEKFLREKGVLVRSMGMFGMPHHLRATVGRDEEMQALIDAIGAFLKGTDS